MSAQPEKLQIVIPCPHATSNVSCDTSLPDYHPLTLDELRELLMLASTATGKLVSQIQVRLDQAIKGMRCPRQSGGDVASRTLKVDDLYVTTYQTDPASLPDLAETFHSLMEGEPK